MICTLCCTQAELFLKSGKGFSFREFFRCGHCDLVFASPVAHLPAIEERARYLEHDNTPTAKGYREFLSRLADCLTPRLTAGAHGMDYGAGPDPQPLLATILEERGFSVVNYDPFFHPDARALDEEYDFITCSETAEHFHRPAEDFARLHDRLKPRGHLAVMTQTLPEWSKFSEWYYPRDPTHVSFYSAQTMEWIAQRFGMRCDRPRPDVTIFTNSPGGNP